MNTDALIAIASLVSSLGVAVAAIVAVFTLREQRAGQRRQTDLENLRWLAHEWKALRPDRRAAAQSLIDGTPKFTHLREVLNYLETCGFLVRKGFIADETLSRSVGHIAVRGWWHWSADYIRERRQAMEGASFWSDVEWLNQHLEPELHDGPWLDHFLQRELGEDADAV